MKTISFSKLFVIVIFSIINQSCVSSRCDKLQIENSRLPPPMVMTWFVDDSITSIETLQYSYDSFLVSKYTKECGTYYALVEKSGKTYQVIPISVHNEKHSTRGMDGSTIMQNCMNPCKRFGANVGDSATLKLIPIFNDSRMPGGFVHYIILCGERINVSRIFSSNVYWGIESDREIETSLKGRAN